MYCGECGAQVQEGDPYCGECGAQQEPLLRPASARQAMPAKKSPSIQLEPGTLLLDRYLIVQRVGGGGMGSVYQARDRRLADRPCAVKEMIEMFADENQRAKAVEDFKREAEVLAQLEHPSIPTVYDYFIEGGRYYLVMKWIGGGDLAQQILKRGGRIDEVTVTKWAIQICDVLHYIHSQNPPIIYRDLKPANLMLDDRTGRVMLVDFGIARFVRPTEKGVTAIGTMGYAPPELFAGKVEPRSDIYSLGATMFHMLTGSDPQDNPLLIFDFTKNPKPRQINPAISPQMEQVLIKAVAYKPEDRWSSAIELMRVLEEHYLRWLGEPKDQITHPAYRQQAQGHSTPIPNQVAAQPQTNPPVEWVYCGHCGQKIASDDVYCPHCGSRQPVQMLAKPRTRPTAQLIVVAKTERVQLFNIDKDSVLLGRTDPRTGIFPEIDLTMYDPQTKVSRRHARIYRQGEQFFIEDLESVNGTIINSVGGGSIRLSPKSPRMLSAGDELKLGETTLKFVIS
jgi:serine/threonine protein kinase